MYFNNLPKFEYEFHGITGSVSREMTDLFRRMGFTKDTQNSKDAFVDWVVKDGYNPDDVAREYYGDPNWFWVVLMSNNIIDIDAEWPKSQTKTQRSLVGQKIPSRRLGRTINIQGSLEGTSLFFYDTRDFLKGDIITVGATCDVNPVDCPDGHTAELNNFAIVDKWHKNLFKLDVKLKGDEFDMNADDLIFHYRKIGNNYNVLSDILCGESVESKPITIRKTTDLIKGVEKFIYEKNGEIREISPFTDTSCFPDCSPTYPHPNDHGICGKTDTLIYKYISGANLGVDDIRARTVEDNIYIKMIEQRKIKLLHRSLIMDLYDEYRLLLNNPELPRGTTKLIEFKG